MFKSSIDLLPIRTQFNKLYRNFIPNLMLSTHTPTCPESKKPVCPTKCDTGGSAAGTSGGVAPGTLKRGDPPKVRLLFLPDNWFTFMHGKTGVSGPYMLLLGLTNYVVSKEIYVMEHEYYSGLSIFVMVMVAYTKFATPVAESLDKQVDAFTKQWEDSRAQELKAHEDAIKEFQHSQWQSKGQELLMNAKKENVLMQLEAAYRERCMQVYQSVKGRMEYQAKRYSSEARIHQRWMIEWILKNVMKSITPDFQKQALSRAISDLEALAGKS